MSEYITKDYDEWKEKTRQGMSVYFPPKTYQEWKEECKKRGMKPSRVGHNLVMKQLNKWKREKNSSPFPLSNL